MDAPQAYPAQTILKLIYEYLHVTCNFISERHDIKQMQNYGKLNRSRALLCFSCSMVTMSVLTRIQEKIQGKRGKSLLTVVRICM